MYQALLGAVPSLLGGDLANSLGFYGGKVISDALFGGLNSSRVEEQRKDAQKAADGMMDSVQKRIPGLMSQLNYNAAGQSGQDARTGFKTALDNWGASNQGMLDYNALKQDADYLRNSTSAQTGLALGESQRNAGTMRRELINQAKNSGAGTAQIAGMASQLGQANSAIAQDLLNKSAGLATNNMAQAAGITAQAQQGLQADKQQQYESRVKPYWNNMQDLGSTLNAMTMPASQAYGSAAAASSKENDFVNLLGGTAAGIGKGSMEEMMLNMFAEYDPNNIQAGGKLSIPQQPPLQMVSESPIAPIPEVNIRGNGMFRPMFDPRMPLSTPQKATQGSQSWLSSLYNDFMSMFSSPVQTNYQATMPPYLNPLLPKQPY